MKFNDQEAQELYNLYLQGMTLKTLAERFKSSNITIKNAILRIGGKVKRYNSVLKDLESDTMDYENIPSKTWY